MSDFIMRLERTFQIAFGHDQMGEAARGLRIDLVSKAPAISGLKITKSFALQLKMKRESLQS